MDSGSGHLLHSLESTSGFPVSISTQERSLLFRRSKPGSWYPSQCDRMTVLYYLAET